MSNTTPLPFQPDAMTPAQLAAVSYPARYSGHTHQLYAYQLRRWFAWCETSQLDPLVGIQRAHVELFIRHLGETGLMPSSINTMMHGVRGFFRFAHIDGLIAADPAVYARLPKIHHDETRTQGLDRLELIRFLQVAQTITVHHGAPAYLLGINALRASEAAAVRIEDYRETLRGHCVLHRSARATSRRPCPSPSQSYACSKRAKANASKGHSYFGPCRAGRSTDATAIEW
jgi:integrase/recombinase XerD